MSYVADEAKRNQWKAELAQHVELSGEQLLGIFPSELIHAYDNYQRAKIGESVLALIDNPLPPPADPVEAEEQDYLKNNVSTYDEAANADEFWDLIYGDDVISQMNSQRGGINEEAYAKALRVRVSIVAHFLFDVIHRSLNQPDQNGEGEAA